MSNLISCQNLSKSFTSRPLFEGLSFGLFENERTGLIGPNGAGKSTLLKILAEIETPDEGTVNRRRGIHVRYMTQGDYFTDAKENATVRDVLTLNLQGRNLEPYEIDMRIDAGMEDAGFDPNQNIGTLSGGWRKRLAILSHVLCEPDLLLLDEPTNHLDVEGVMWLEKFLQGLSFSFLVVTHDRWFLESVCNRVIELNKKYKDGHFSSTGNYSNFIENREKLFTAQAAQEESTRNKVRRELEWLSRGPKARTTKQKAHIDRVGKLVGELKELEFRNAQDRSASIDFSGSHRQSKLLIDAQQISMSRGGKKLFGPTDIFLSPGSKLGLLGGNGSGKSTLIKILADDLQPDDGLVKRAEGLKVVTFDQHREQLDLDLPLRRALCESGEKVLFQDRYIHVFGWAERFLFTKEQLDMPLHRLSGGEQARVLMARLMLKPADILLLDEPTNDLDIASLEVLENSMMEFPGALVLITHDRYLLDRVSQGLLYLDGNGSARHYADLAQWEMAQEERREYSPPIENVRQKKEEPKAQKKSKREIEKELKKLEKIIQEAESDQRKAQAALEDPAIAANASELLNRQATLHQADGNLLSLLETWEKLQKESLE